MRGAVMGEQRTFASMAWTHKGKVTRRERFCRGGRGHPWPRLPALIEPHYPKAGQGRQPLGLEKMLRIYFLHSGSTCRTHRLKTRSTTASRCAGLREWNWATTWCRTSPRFCASPTAGAAWLTQAIFDAIRVCSKSAGCCCARGLSSTRRSSRRRVRRRTPVRTAIPR